MSWAEIAALERVGDHYERSWADGFLTVSSDGMDEMIAQARVMEDCAEALEALTPYLGHCEHGLDIAELIESGDWRWGVNDYVEYAHKHRPTELVIMLGGFHDYEWVGPISGTVYQSLYCIRWAYNPAGVLYPW